MEPPPPFLLLLLQVVPDEAIAEMKASFSMPAAGEFEDVLYVEADADTAPRIVEQQRGAGEAWLAWMRRESEKEVSGCRGVKEMERLLHIPVHMLISTACHHACKGGKVEGARTGAGAAGAVDGDGRPTQRAGTAAHIGTAQSHQVGL